MLNTSKQPQNEVPFDVISSASAIAGLPARQTIPAGVPITLSMFQTQGSTSNKEVLRALDPGFRAMAVQVDQVTGVGTIIQPGDRVDVVISFEDTDGKFPIIYEGAPTVSAGPAAGHVRTFENFDDKLNNDLHQGPRPGLQGPRHAAPASAGCRTRAGPRRPPRRRPARSRSTASSRSSSCS